jgi:hypothetical protein
MIPEDRIVVALISNLQTPSLYETALSIAKIWQNYQPSNDLMTPQRDLLTETKL